MKVLRAIPLCLCLVMAVLLTQQAAAAGETSLADLEQRAAELSQCTGYVYYKDENTERYLSYRQLHPDYTLDAIISYVNIGLDHPFYTNPVQIADPYSTYVLVNKYRPLSQDFVPGNLEMISGSYRYGTQKLRHNARIAFEKLCAAAKKCGYPIWAVSSYRDYSKQAQLYASYLDPADPNSAAKRDLLVARPGYSEHQTGLAVDISRIDGSVKTADVNTWMMKNAYKYGFIIRYPAGKEGITGVMNEPWHLRYLGTTMAAAVCNSGLTYDEYYVRYLDTPAVSANAAVIGVTATSDIAVDGVPYRLSVYRITGDTYYKLRDIAVVLNGTSASFDIAWNSEAGRIELLSGAPYSSERTLGTFDSGHAAVVSPAAPALMAGAAVYDLSAYNAGGTLYIKLSDILTILGLSASDDGMGVLSIGTPAIPVNAPEQTTPPEVPAQ